MAMTSGGQQKKNIAFVGLTVAVPSFLLSVLVCLILIYLALQLYVAAITAAASFLILLGVLACVSYIARTASWFGWTGFAQSQRVVNGQRRGRTLWDWLGLLIVPFILSAGVVGFSAFQNQANTEYNKRQANIAAIQQTNTMTIAHNQEQQSIVQSYLDRMSDLLLNPNIRLKQGQQGVDLRILARARTLTILLDLDTDQKATIVRFLYYGELIGQYKLDPTYAFYDPVVDLTTANLSGVNLDDTYLGGANFQVANLSGASLIGANLSGAYLAGVNLSNAHLHQAYFCYANFTGAALLKHADLSNAHLSGVNLMGADLTNVNLSGANLSATDPDPACPAGKPPVAANLTNANLTGANLSNAILTGVIWGNTTCPDGKNSNSVGGSCMQHLKV